MPQTRFRNELQLLPRPVWRLAKLTLVLLPVPCQCRQALLIPSFMKYDRDLYRSSMRIANFQGLNVAQDAPNNPNKTTKMNTSTNRTRQIGIKPLLAMLIITLMVFATGVAQAKEK